MHSSSRQKIFQVEGVVLGKFDRSERDTVFSLMTKERGRILVLAKYAKKVPSRHNAGLDLFNVVRCQLYDGRFLPVVTQAQQIGAFDGLFTSLSRLELAYKLSILLDALVQRGQESEELYTLTLQCLRHIATEQENRARLAFIHAAFTLLGIVGSLRWSPLCQQCDRTFCDSVHCVDSRFVCSLCVSTAKAEMLPVACYRLLGHAVSPFRLPSHEIGQKELSVLVSFLHRQVAEFSYPSYLERVSFALAVSERENAPILP